MKDETVTPGNMTAKHLTYSERGELRRKANAEEAKKKARIKIAKSRGREKSTGSSRLMVQRASDVKPRRVRGMWRRRFARGMVSGIVSEPGQGKGHLVVFMAASITTGGPWPCSQGHASRGDVVYISAEDTAADVIRPRLEVAGANLRRVHIIDGVSDTKAGRRPFSLIADLDLLRGVLRKLPNPRLVIVDPLNACLSPSERKAFNPNSVHDVRALLSRLDALARKYDVAVILVTHFAKKGGTALARVAGSFALTAAMRSVFTVERDSRDPKRRIFAALKNNIGHDQDALAFRIKSAKTPTGLRTSIVQWEHRPVRLPAAATGKRHSVTTLEVMDFLKQLVPAKGMSAEKILKNGEAAGFTKKELRTGREALGMVSRKGRGTHGGWIWLPKGRDEHPDEKNIARRRQKSR